MMLIQIKFNKKILNQNPQKILYEKISKSFKKSNKKINQQNKVYYFNIFYYPIF